MTRILFFCIFALFCGASLAEQMDSRGLAIDDSLSLQNVWLSEEDTLDARYNTKTNNDNDWVSVPAGVYPDPVTCTFPTITPNSDVVQFNLSGTPYATFDLCSVKLTQKWQAVKIISGVENVADGYTTFKLGYPSMVPVPHCAYPIPGGNYLDYASAPPEHLFKFHFDTKCWSTNQVLEAISPIHAAFTYGTTVFNLCPELDKSKDCLQRFEVPANQFSIGVYDSDTDVLSIRRGPATTDGKTWYTTYHTQFGYDYKCTDDELKFNMGTLISSFSRINYLSQAGTSTTPLCKVV